MGVVRNASSLPIVKYVVNLCSIVKYVVKYSTKFVEGMHPSDVHS